MGICNKLAWPVAPVFLAFVIGKETTDTLISDLYLPFYIIIGVFMLLGVVSLMAPLPEVKAAGEDPESGDESAYASSKTSIWQFPHLLLGALALFFYVGVETVALGTLVDYASWLNLPNASMYAWISPIGMVIGYICGIIFIPKYLSQANALMICSILGIAGSILVVLTPAAMSIWFLALIAIGCSLIWPAIWPLAMADLGKFTKTGSSFLVMAIAGGAIIPTAYGFLKDSVGAQNSYWIALPIFIYILYYGISGYKIRTSASKQN
jgi:fucose permease